MQRNKMSNWLQHYAVTRLVLLNGNAFSFTRTDCQMVPVDIDAARLIIVAKTGMKSENTLVTSRFDLKCIEYSICMVNPIEKKLRVAHFFHPFTAQTYIDQLTIRPMSGRLFETEDMSFLLKSKDLKGYQGVQFVD